MQQPQAQPPPQQQGRGNQQGGFSWSGLLIRLMIMYFVMQYFFGGKAKTTVDPVNGKAHPPHRNVWPNNQPMDLYIYMLESDKIDYNADITQNLIWSVKRLEYNWESSNEVSKTLSFKPSKDVLNNGTLFAHIIFTKAGRKPADGEDDPIHFVHSLVKYRPKPKLTGKKNLLSGEKDDLKAPNGTLSASNVTELVSFWKPNLTLHLVHDHTAYPYGGIPHQVAPSYILNANGDYLPIVYINEFWLMKEHLQPINETVEELTLYMSYSPISLWKWQLQSQMDQSFATQESWGAREGESEDFKRMLVETNPYLLALTFVISILHSIFDFLAFKNDIAFWKNNKSMEGLSVKTIILNCACQLIIFLYLLDNETSWLILISSGVGLLIELWKIQKAMIVTIDWSGSIPMLRFQDKQSYVSRTKEFDDIAMKKLSYLLYALLIGYSIYALIYETHKSWYSWILSSLVGAVYTFGFVLMTPQLFINYKLKSVAHLPWKTFMYKALNTFIDDLFAFIIKMPTLHRLSCLRDDFIFLIYLYQRWIYPVDKKRTNEFGQTFVEPQPGEEQKEITDSSSNGSSSSSSAAEKKTN